MFWQWICSTLSSINTYLLCNDDQILFMEVYQVCVNFAKISESFGLIMTKVPW